MGREKRSVEAFRDEIASFFWLMLKVQLNPDRDPLQGIPTLIENPEAIFSEKFDNDNSTLHHTIKRLRSKLASLSVEERMRVYDLTFKNQKG